jgi:hypothetical protein
MGPLGSHVYILLYDAKGNRLPCERMCISSLRTASALIVATVSSLL